MVADLLHTGGNLEILLIKQELMQLHHIVGQGLRDNAVADGTHVLLSAGHGEAHGIRDIKLGDYLGQRIQVIRLQVCGQLRHDGVHASVEGLEIRLLCFFQGLFHHDSLALRAGVVRIAVTDSRIGNRLDAVQMDVAAVLQLRAGNAGLLDGL